MITNYIIPMPIIYNNGGCSGPWTQADTNISILLSIVSFILLLMSIILEKSNDKDLTIKNILLLDWRIKYFITVISVIFSYIIAFTWLVVFLYKLIF